MRAGPMGASGRNGKLFAGPRVGWQQGLVGPDTPDWVPGCLSLPLHPGVWYATVWKTWVMDSRFRCARFAFDDGTAILVPADDLKAVLARWLADREHIFMPRIRINPTEGTLNGIPVAMERCQY